MIWKASSPPGDVGERSLDSSDDSEENLPEEFTAREMEMLLVLKMSRKEEPDIKVE